MRLNSKVLFDSSAAESGSWFPATSYSSEVTRSVQISMNSSDSIELEATTIQAKDAADLETKVTAADITVLQTYTSGTDFNDAIVGPWTFFRVTKVGANGAAKVQGLI